MNSLIISNISVYKEISDEAYLKMVELIENGRTPKADGSKGWVVKYDPKQNSFKQAMISIVFTGMWLEALMHLLIVKKYDNKTFKNYDFKSYEDKLGLLGCTDKDILKLVEKFRKCRKELVHEKAYFDNSEIKQAQEEAINAHKLLTSVSEHFESKKD